MNTEKKFRTLIANVSNYETHFYVLVILGLIGFVLWKSSYGQGQAEVSQWIKFEHFLRSNFPRDLILINFLYTKLHQEHKQTNREIPLSNPGEANATVCRKKRWTFMVITYQVCALSGPPPKHTRNKECFLHNRLMVASLWYFFNSKKLISENSTLKWQTHIVQRPFCWMRFDLIFSCWLSRCGKWRWKLAMQQQQFGCIFSSRHCNHK